MKIKIGISFLTVFIYNILLALFSFLWFEVDLKYYLILLVLGSLIIFLVTYYKVIKPTLSMIDRWEQTENMRKEFVANVTHEFKTPLTSISGFVETLQEGADEDREVRKKFLDIIAIETSRLSRLIEDVFILSDIESKKTQEALESFDVGTALRKIVMSINPVAQAKGIEILLEVKGNPVIKGNQDRFSQMMMNLIENAVKYSKEGKSISVSAEENQENIVVSVKDEGIGIEEKEIPRLFERFYRVDKSRSKDMGGTGLGLSIVKHIASLFDAQIKVTSEPGRGTTFTVAFPK
ncbi:MAG: ATP-binding protein [Anaerovoracaceae bacterium]|nr:GHKL domain-containing protein [Clostridiales bacterium]